MSYIRSLREILRGKDQELHARLSHIEKIAEGLLTYTTGKFPYYTPHDFVTHSRNVEENLNWIIDDDVKEKLHPLEIFFLLVAAWLHDWGMIGKAEEDPKEIRMSHNLRTEEYLEKLHDKVYLSSHEARIIGKIGRGHTKEDLQMDYYADVIFGANIPIRIRFLTACLRIADECDITANRTPEIIYYSLNPTDKAEEEFNKNLSISGIGRPEIEKHKIQLFGIAWDPKAVTVLEQVQKKIQEELNSVKVFLAQQGIIIDYVELKVDTRGFINKPIEFVLDRERIVNLLMGSHLYSRKDSAIRELLQNAVDTCRLKKSLKETYVPSITFRFGAKRISVEDNGIGMDFEDANKFLSKKGFSFYSSKELEDLLKGKEFVPISKFGIGALSCFLIATGVIIDSRKNGCEACRFIIKNLADGWRYEKSSRTTDGTQITLLLDEDIKIDLEESLKHYAKKIEIPITLINDDTGESKSLEQQWDSLMPEIGKLNIRRYGKARSRTSRIQDDIVASHTIQSDGIEAKYFLLKEDSSLFIEERNCFLSHQGIYVGNFAVFPFFIGRWFVLVNCTKELFDISVSREDLIRNERYLDFVRMLHDNFLKFVETEVLKGRDDRLQTFDFCLQYTKLLNYLLDDSMAPSYENIESELFLKIGLEKVYPTLDSNGLKLLSGKDIFSNQFKKIYHYILPLAECKQHIDSVAPLLKEFTKEGELIVFDVGPHFSVTFKTKDQAKSILFILCEKKDIYYESLDLFKVLRNSPFRRVSTPLDPLLPGKSSFVEMPKEFASLVLYRRQYEFVADDKQVLDFSIYHQLLGRELFHDEPVLSRVYDSELKKVTEAEFRKVNDGEFLYDINDSLLKLIVGNAERIISNDFLKGLVRSYFRYLALLSLSNPFEQTDWCYLWSIEQMIMTIFGQQEKYQNLFDRMGKIGIVLNGYRAIPSESIHDWMFSST